MSRKSARRSRRGRREIAQSPPRKTPPRWHRYLIAGVAIAAAAVVAFGLMQWRDRPAGSDEPTVMPELSRLAALGAGVYERHCAECHGKNLRGNDKGPPLLHAYYEPSHHSDLAFEQAILQGARAHHWRFGDMKPTQGVSRSQVPAVIAYVREVQRANGIQ